ncbi:MAG: RraA family protein [Rhizobiales bacterium]|nr:RraA family protein [Hyphomicrobiales bacterium]
MIEDPPILRVRRNFPRPAQELVTALTGAATGHVVDAMGGGGALDGRIRPLSATQPGFCGVAITCDAGPADNLALFAALDAGEPGDVIVAATGGHLAAAVTGDLLIGMARNCGIAALVTDGAVRDVAGILAVGVPVLCAGVSANSPARNGPGTVGLPIVIGGIAVRAGDIVIGDGDGVAIVPQARAAEVIARLAEVRAAERLRTRFAPTGSPG